MPPRKSPLFDTATTVGKIMSFLGISALCGLLFVGLVFPLAATGGAAATAGSDLLEDVPAEMTEEPLSTPSRIYANDGETLIATFYAENRTPVALDDISQTMQDAMISIEDERFYQHGGVDGQGLARAAVHTLTQPSQQGASTLTMQYVNNVLNNAAVVRGEGEVLGSFAQEKTYADKLREMKLAVSVEQEMTKDEILEGYLNIVMLGGQNYGVEAAAQQYWGVPASELNIQQSAMLAGMVQAPNYYKPDDNHEVATDRRDTVIASMQRNGYITEQERDEAMASDLNLSQTEDTRLSGCVAANMGHYFCDYVQRHLLANEDLGDSAEEREQMLLRGGLNVVTTLDPDAQQAAEDEVFEAVPVDDDSGNRASIVSTSPETGDILAMAQSTVYDPDDADDGHDTVNYNVDFEYGDSGGFNVGSTLKPFISAAWIEEGGSMDDYVDASVEEYDYGEEWEASCMPGGTVPLRPDGESDTSDTWGIENVGDLSRRMTVDNGLYYSANTATVATAREMDLCAIDDVLDRLDIKRAAEVNDSFDVNLASTPAAMLGAAELSPMTLASAYGAFANDGQLCEPRAFLEITDAQGNEYPVPETDCEEVVDPEVVAQVNDTLINAAERPLISTPFPPDDPPFPMLGKTGTAAGSSNTWFAGATEGMASVTHIGQVAGNDRQLSPTINGVTYDDGFYGSSLAQPVWYEYMMGVADDFATGDFATASDSPFDDRRTSYPRPDAYAPSSEDSDDEDNGDDDSDNNNDDDDDDS
ncbi:MAG: transglycosylase domain-containing protein [Nesterenkonia sp.]